MAKNIFFKTTKGINAEAIVALAMATETDIATFQDTASEGEIQVFDVDTNESVAVAELNQRIYIAQKRDGQVNKMTPIVFRPRIVGLYEYVAPASDVWTVNLAAGTVVAGDNLELVLVETTPLAQPFPMYNFDVTVRAGETQAAALGRLVALINDQFALQWNYYGQLATAALNAGDIVLTGVDPNRTFKVVVRQTLNDLQDTTGIVHTTTGTPGVGTYDSIRNLEAEAHIFQGVTTNYPLHGLPGEYGEPTFFSASGTNYDMFVLSAWTDEYSPTPINKHHHLKYQIVAAATGGAVVTALSLVLGITEAP